MLLPGPAWDIDEECPLPPDLQKAHQSSPYDVLLLFTFCVCKTCVLRNEVSDSTRRVFQCQSLRFWGTCGPRLSLMLAFSAWSALKQPREKDAANPWFAGFANSKHRVGHEIHWEFTWDLAHLGSLWLSCLPMCDLVL